MSQRTARLIPARIAAAAACLVALAVLPVAPVRAGVLITVTAPTDVVSPDGKCSIREAITVANDDAALYGATGECPAGSGTDTIRFLPDRSWPVNSQLPVITTSMTIDGGGRATLDGTGANGIFRQTGGTVVIERMTLFHAAGTMVSKGGGTLTLSAVGIANGSGNVAIANTVGSITIKGSEIAANSSPGINGGGLYNAATATVLDSTFNGNGAVLGGGIYNDGVLTVRRTTLRENTANLGLFSYAGGALVNHGTATVTASAFTANVGSNAGGAIANDGTLTMANVTIAGNVAGGIASGGGIYSAGTLTLLNATVTHNSAAAYGGGLMMENGAPTVIKNSIVAGNSATNGDADLSGLVLASAWTHNVIGPVASLATYLDANGARANGGPTPTVQIYRKTGSPFIDKGSSSVCTSTTVGSKDQRGVPRPSACDIGAVEHERTDPSMTSAPKVGIGGGYAVVGAKLPVRVTFGASDGSTGSGVKRYSLSLSTNGGSWTSVNTSIAVREWPVALALNSTYRFRVRAVDFDGNVSSWSYGPTFKTRLVGDTSSSITYSSGWKTRSSVEDLGGSSHYATTAGRSVRITFTGRAIALVGFRTTSTTSVKVYVDGTYVGTASTSGDGSYKAITWTRRWSTSATRTIRLVVASAAAPSVYVDAFAILK